MLRRRRPVLRAAAVGGGAYAMGRRRAEREAEAAEAPMPEAAPAARGPSSADIERLRELGRLREQGVITEEELAQQKARILG